MRWLMRWLEWAATAVLLIGVALTSWNIYPANLYFSLAGNLIWFVVGIGWRKWSLVSVQAVISAIYIVGMVRA